MCVLHLAVTFTSHMQLLGIGIDAQRQEAIFTKYFRLDNKIEGTGVGLYLVKEIKSNAGGKTTLQCEPGKGSEFKVYLKI